MDHPLQFGVERDQKWYRAVAPRRDLRDVFRQQRAVGLGREIGGEFGRQLVRIGEGKFLGVGLDEKIEGIDDREFGGEIDLDLEFLDRLGKDVAREPVAVRVLLPIDEVVGRRDLERIARHPRAAMGRRTQSDRLRAERDRPVVAVTGDVMQADENRQRERLSRGDALACLQGAGRATIWRRRRLACQWRVARTRRTCPIAWRSASGVIKGWAHGVRETPPIATFNAGLASKHAALASTSGLRQKGRR